MKFIEQKIDLPSIRSKLIEFAEWVAQYNVVPIGMLAKVIMGGVLKINQIDKLVYAEQKQKISNISYKLSPEQQVARDKIISNLNEYSVTLLDGETGSGKTEVYLSVIAELIKNIPAFNTQLYECYNIRVIFTKKDVIQVPRHWNLISNQYTKQLYDKDWISVLSTGMTSSTTKTTCKLQCSHTGMTLEVGNAQVLILLPEIVLTSQLVSRVRNQTSGNIAQWHSGLTLKSRRNNWLSIANGSAQIVIGARSALFFIL